jgi:GNAT superfamily N-acetyltransferase
MAEQTRTVPPYSLRVATLADRPLLLPLLEGLAPERDQAKHVRWLYDENPEGPAITWVAVDDGSGEIAGVTSYFPWRLLVEGRVVRAAIGGDGFVPPKFRRRGIAAALHSALRAEMSRLGLAVMFGAPAAMNRNPLRASGSVRISEHVRHIRPLAASAARPRLAVLDPVARRLLAPRR